MLIELQCDKFISNGKVREPIKFHAGLNSVLGDDNASNSIGKSTFLMILDFVFGGSDYVNKCKDVQENVKDHTLNFTFDFERKQYCFSRNSVDYKYVTKCDTNYKPLPENSRISVEEYGQFLSKMYGVSTDGLKWRGAVSRFIRVYKRETLHEDKPLKSADNETDASAVKAYMQLFNKYLSVEAQIKQAAQADDEKETFRKSQQYNYIRIAKNKTEYDQNEKRASELELKEKSLAEKSNQGLLDLDSVQARQLAELNNQVIDFRRQRARVQTRLNAIRKDMLSGKKSFKRTYNDLEKFFPEVNFQTIENIEGFHQNLSKVLTDEFKETEADLVSAYVLLGNEIVKLEEQITQIKNIPNVSQAILKEYAEITTDLSNVRESNKNFKELAKLKKIADEYAKTRDLVIGDQLLSIESPVNQKMREISIGILKDETHMPPVLRLEKLNKYTFNTPNDGGTGAQYRGVITFDLANMAVSSLPFVIHDSVMLKHIEKKVFAEILEEYCKEKSAGKQVFMAFDMLDAYSDEAGKLLRDNKVIELSPNGNELFGWAWNKENGNGASEYK